MPSWEPDGSPFKFWSLLESEVTYANEVEMTASWEVGFLRAARAAPGWFSSARQTWQISSWSQFPRALFMNCPYISTPLLLPALFIKIKDWQNLGQVLMKRFQRSWNLKHTSQDEALPRLPQGPLAPGHWTTGASGQWHELRRCWQSLRSSPFSHRDAHAY